jgi:hypothetical protein
MCWSMQLGVTPILRAASARVAPAAITACCARREAPITVVAREPSPTNPQRNVLTAMPHPSRAQMKG